MDDLRVFIAVKIDSPIQRILASIQSDLKKSGADVKWVNVEGIHLTLKFLGDITFAQLNQIQPAMEQSCRRKPFSISIKGLGAFPKIDQPRIIWTEITEEKNELKLLAEELEKNLEAAGFPKEGRDFHAHITLGRARSAQRQFALVKLLKEYTLPEIPAQQVSQITLFKSTLTSDGPVYESLVQIPLRVS